MDPNQPPDQRRPSTLLPILLIFLASYFAIQQCQKSLQPPPAPEPAGTAVPAAPADEPDPPPGDFAATTGVEQDDAIVVDTATFRARFTNRGAALVELLLKHYWRTSEDARDEARRADPNNWLPLIAPHDPAAPTFRLVHNARDAASGSLPLERACWEHERIAGAGGEELVFRIADGTGRRFEKRFRFRPDGYFFDVELRFASDRGADAQGTASYGFVAAGGIWDERNSPYAKPPAAALTLDDDDDLQLVAAGELDDGPQSRGIARNGLAPFFGVRSNFFGFVLSPDAASAGRVDSVTCARVDDPFRFEQARLAALDGRAELPAAEARELHDEARTNVRAEAFLSVPFGAAGGEPLALRFTAFAGPRAPEAMPGPEGDPFRILYEIEYGSWTSFRWINRLLLGWMKLLERFTGNWGVAIILLTVTVKALLFPLNRLQSRTMEQFQKKMKLLQPQIEELKKRHKSNAQKLAAEQQKLMREHGVRPPVFGCLVIFLQMPVWYGLFQIMSSAPSLRQAPFCLWISDLSAPDVVPLPFELPLIGQLHLLPLLMVAAWLLQNRMMPKPADPQQAQMQKMMNFFPFIFLVMLYKYAAGQSLYMVVNSLLGMLQMKFLRVTPSS